MSPEEMDTLEIAVDQEGTLSAGDTVETQIAQVPVAPAARMERRHFIRVAAAVAAATGAVATGALAQSAPAAPAPAAGGAGGAGAAPGRAGGAGGGGGAAQQAAPPIPINQTDSPALVFQAYPGGTGALYEKLIKERGIAAFERKPIEVAPWGNAPVPTTEEGLAFLPASRLGALLKERKISSIDITNIYLERAKRYNGVLLAYVTILEGRAREEAQQADRDIRAGNWKGPLHGVPYGVKDLFAVTGAPTMWGSADFQTQTFDFDAELVVRLRNAGAVLLGKLATGMFASGDNWFRGQTKNPWNVTQGSSGSSAGPGSATAAGLVGFSIGTETSGSIVSPAGRNGLSALRPTYGRISRHGGMVLSWGQDKPGPICRSIEDCALVFNAIHGVDTKDPSTLTTPFEFKRLPNLNGLRIGYVPNSPQQAPQEFLDELKAMGATLSELPTLPNVQGGFGAESAAFFDFYYQQQVKGFEARGEAVPTNIRFGGTGRTGSALDFIQTQRRRLIGMKEWDRLLAPFDIMVGGLATGAANQTGHPAVVVPYKFGQAAAGGGGGGGGGGGAAAGAGAGGAPAAPAAPPAPQPDQPRTVTIHAQLFNDDLALSVAHAFQIRHDFHTHHPTIPV